MASKPTRERVIQLLKEKLNELERPELQVDGSPEFMRWHQEVEAILRNYFGDDSQQLKNFRSASTPVYPGYSYLTDTEETIRKRAQVAHKEMLPRAKAALEAVIFEVEKFDFPALGVEPTELPQDSLDDERTIRAELEQFHDRFHYYRGLVLTQKGLERKRATLPNKQLREIRNLKVDLQRKYGSLQTVIEKYGGRAIVFLQGREYEAFDSAFNYTQFSLEALTTVMDSAITAVNKAIGKLKAASLPESVRTDTTLAPPKAFIANGGETPALNKLSEFLNALGVIPVIAQEQPSEDRSVDEQVDWCLDQCDCAIILATKGDIDGRTGKFIPRGNILIEIGKCQERFPGRIVYLIESDTKFPSNISEKVRVRFSPQSMDKAFIKVAKELTAFELIKAVKTQ